MDPATSQNRFKVKRKSSGTIATGWPDTPGTAPEGQLSTKDLLQMLKKGLQWDLTVRMRQLAKGSRRL
jgi:hypothetical protein